jgi:ABC-type nickel/cobalt efflux system permease component RcnA
MCGYLNCAEEIFSLRFLAERGLFVPSPFVHHDSHHYEHISNTGSPTHQHFNAFHQHNVINASTHHHNHQRVNTVINTSTQSSSTQFAIVSPSSNSIA